MAKETSFTSNTGKRVSIKLSYDNFQATVRVDDAYMNLDKRDLRELAREMQQAADHLEHVEQQLKTLITHVSLKPLAVFGPPVEEAKPPKIFQDTGPENG